MDRLNCRRSIYNLLGLNMSNAVTSFVACTFLVVLVIRPPIPASVLSRGAVLQTR